MKNPKRARDICTSSYRYFKNYPEFEGRLFGSDELVDVIYDKTIPDSNIWDDAPIKLKVFRTQEGFLGYYYSEPDGYSEYTYSPDETTSVYNICDLDVFKRLCLTEDLRSML